MEDAAYAMLIIAGLIGDQINRRNEFKGTREEFLAQGFESKVTDIIKAKIESLQKRGINVSYNLPE